MISFRVILSSNVSSSSAAESVGLMMMFSEMTDLLVSSSVLMLLVSYVLTCEVEYVDFDLTSSKRSIEIQLGLTGERGSNLPMSKLFSLV